MSEHPEEQELLVEAPGDELRSHLASCSACRVRRRRLRAFAFLVAEAQEPELPPIAWAQVEQSIQQASEDAARARKRQLREQEGRWQRVGLGAALAAAAALLLSLGVRRSAEPPRTAVSRVGEVARRAVAQVRAAATRAPEAAPRLEQTEASVLLVAGDVQWSAAGGSPQRLELSQPVRRGVRVRAGRDGRVLLSLPGGARVDLRPGGTLTLERLGEQGNRVLLAEGEARVDASGTRTSLAVERATWQVHAVRGALVAKVEAEQVQLRVVAGKVDLELSPTRHQEVDAGQRWLVSKDGTQARAVGGEAQDPSSLEDLAVAAQGAPVELPSAPRGASLWLGARALPVNSRGVRRSVAAPLLARSGGTVLSLRAEEGSSPRWEAQEVAARAVAARAPSGAASPPGAPVVPVAAAAAPVPQRVVLDAALDSADARAELSRRLGARLRTCAAACPAGQCEGPTRGYVALDVNTDGSYSRVGVESLPAGLRACMTQGAQALVAPPSLRARNLNLFVEAR